MDNQCVMARGRRFAEEKGQAKSGSLSNFRILGVFFCPAFLHKEKSYQRDKSLWRIYILLCLLFDDHKLSFLNLVRLAMGDVVLFSARARSRCRLAFRNYFCHKDECHPKKVGS